MLGLVLRLVVTAAFLVIAAGLVFLFVPAVGDVSNEAFGSSLSRSVDAKRDARCTGKEGERSRRCTVRTATYELRVRDRRCFRAERKDGGTSPPLQRGSACVRLRDQVSFADSALDAVGL